MLEQIRANHLDVRHLLKITHMAGTTHHYLAILKDGRYVCDCCMGTNLGLPCRHYFRALADVTDFRFHIGVIRPR
jgi:hypothetical protein